MALMLTVTALGGYQRGMAQGLPAEPDASAVARRVAL
jgi:hypothetical protein